MSLLDQLPSAALITDASGQVLDANAELLTLLGATRGALATARLDDFLPPAGRIFLQTHVWPTLWREGQVRELHLQLLGDRQQRVPVLLNVRQGDLDGRTVWFWSLFVAHERHRFEAELVRQRNLAEDATQALVEHQQFLRTLTDAVPGLLAYWDRDLRCQFANQSWLDSFGLTRETALGQSMATLLGSALTNENAAAVQGALQGQAQSFERDHSTPSGEPRQVLVQYVPHRADGAVQGFVASVTDLSTVKQGQQALAREHARLRNLVDATHAGTWEWNVRTGEVIVNARWAEILGWRLAELGPLNNQFRVELSHPDELPHTRDLLRAHFAGLTEDYVNEVRLRHRAGHWVWVEDRGRVITRTADGQPEWMYGIHIDISQRKQREDALAHLSEELARQYQLMHVTLQSIGDAVITTDGLGRVTWLNPVAERMTGWLASEAEGQPSGMVFHIVHEHSREPAPDPVQACLRAEQPVGLAEHTLLLSRNGLEFGIEDSAAPIRGQDGRTLGVVLVFHDVSEQRRLSGEMTYRATHDALTGLVNRAEFEQRLERALQQARDSGARHAMLFIDLDQFKLVNDACGHPVGDQLLQQIGKLLADVVRARDTLARLGGDEFAILLEHCNPEQAARVAQKICDRMEDYRFVHDERRFRLGTSIGLVPVDERWSSVLAIQQAADAACYAAKEAGRNRVHAWYDTDTGLRVRHQHVHWASRIEHALDHGGFELFAQRMQCLGTASSGLHAEVLLRLRNDDGSLTLPGAFLPAAERFHLVSRIDRWVLRQTVEWLLNQPSLQQVDSLSVNLSGQSVGDRAFHAWAMELLSAAGARVCSRLWLEITETAAVTNMADAALFIAQVRQAGVKVALDDFGAGASSFGYLKSLPVDVLKIDGQFIRDLVTDALDDAAVRCFADVARVMGLQTVAEFVDSPAVLLRLREIGVDHAQGFLIHEPEPLARLFAATGAAAV